MYDFLPNPKRLAAPAALAGRGRGFTLVEVMVVVSIAAILAVLAVPSFTSTLNNTRQSSALNLLLSDLNLARGEAIKRNARMLVCARDTAGTGCTSSTNWALGWLVCSDANSDNACDAGSASNPNPVLVRPALNAALTLAAGSTDPVRFSANSAAVAAATLTLGGTWAGATARTLSVAVTGNISK